MHIQNPFKSIQNQYKILLKSYSNPIKILFGKPSNIYIFTHSNPCSRIVIPSEMSLTWLLQTFCWDGKQAEAAIASAERRSPRGATPGSWSFTVSLPWLLICSSTRATNQFQIISPTSVTVYLYIHFIFIYIYIF